MRRERIDRARESLSRHCEEALRADAAIQTLFLSGLLRYARNDDRGARHALFNGEWFAHSL